MVAAPDTTFPQGNLRNNGHKIFEVLFWKDIDHCLRFVSHPAEWFLSSKGLTGLLCLKISPV
jgi:hypothetical protein